MIINLIKLSDYKPAEYNPRLDLKKGDEAYEKLDRSFDDFGNMQPVVVNKQTGNIVSGHQRVKILQAKGITETEAVIVNFSIEKEKLANSAMNRVSGSWDEEKLVVLFKELSQIPDIDIGSTGWDKDEISEILDRYSDPIDIGETAEDPEKIENPITQPGDLIELGHHRVLCGDSSRKEDVEKLLGGKKICLFWSDPPYNVSYDSKSRPLGDKSDSNNTPNWRKISNDSLPQDEYEIWLEKVLTNVSDYFQQGAPFYIWNGHRQFGPMQDILLKLGFHVSCVITWAKERFALGFGDYNNQTEFCLYGWKAKNGGHSWYGPNNESTLWDIRRDAIADNQHPTQKTVELAARAIRNSSKRGDIVFDAFLGSGTALIAAESLERVCYGMELDPRYCDVIVRRYVDLAGKDKVSEDIINRYINKMEVSNV